MLYTFDPQRPNSLFIGHRQTVQTYIRRRKMRHLIRVSTVCLLNVLLKLERKWKISRDDPKNGLLALLIWVGNSIWFQWVKIVLTYLYFFMILSGPLFLLGAWGLFFWRQSGGNVSFCVPWFCPSSREERWCVDQSRWNMSVLKVSRYSCSNLKINLLTFKFLIIRKTLITLGVCACICVCVHPTLTLVSSFEV